MRKKIKNVAKFYRQSFFKNLHLLTKKEKPSTGYKLMAFLVLRKKRVKLISEYLSENLEASLNNKYLCYSLNKCSLPAYLSVKSRYIKSGPIAHCSKVRLCAYCWIRRNCKSHCVMLKSMAKADEHVYAFKELVTEIDADTTTENLKKAGVALFTKRHNFKASRLKKENILGLAEMLCVYPTGNNKKTYTLQLRQFAYCHKTSKFAKEASFVDSKPLNLPCVNFCSFPSKLMLAKGESLIKINEAFKSTKLVRKYGSMFNPKKDTKLKGA